MNKARLTAMLFASTLLIAGCTNQEMGQATGGALGGYLGSTIGKGSGRLAATALGAVAGTLIGGSIGRSMDETDRYQASRALETAPTGQTVAWVNPDNGSRYAVTPQQTYETASGPCREYTTDATIGGRRESVYGTACRQPDGSWKTVQ